MPRRAITALVVMSAPRPPRVDAIIDEVAEGHRVHPAAILLPVRQQKYDLARAEAMWRVRQLTMAHGKPPSFPQIGKWFGGRHHTTVMHNVRAHEARSAG